MNKLVKAIIYPSPQRKLGSPRAFPLAEMIQGMPASAGMTRETELILYRHPDESRDPTVRAKSAEVRHNEAWIPAFAGMTKFQYEVRP
jgi:hypothetical protein